MLKIFSKLFRRNKEEETFKLSVFNFKDEIIAVLHKHDEYNYIFTQLYCEKVLGE